MKNISKENCKKEEKLIIGHINKLLVWPIISFGMDDNWLLADMPKIILNDLGDFFTIKKIKKTIWAITDKCWPVRYLLDNIFDLV